MAPSLQAPDATGRSITRRIGGAVALAGESTMAQQNTGIDVVAQAAVLLSRLSAVLASLTNRRSEMKHFRAIVVRVNLCAFVSHWSNHALVAKPSQEVFSRRRRIFFRPDFDAY